jgi:hypothetical protein
LFLTLPPLAFNFYLVRYLTLSGPLSVAATDVVGGMTGSVISPCLSYQSLTLYFYYCSLPFFTLPGPLSVAATDVVGGMTGSVIAGYEHAFVIQARDAAGEWSS